MGGAGAGLDGERRFGSGGVLMPARRSVGVWSVVGGLLLAVPAYPQTIPDKSGTRPTVLSLPGGPGSIEGLGKSFQPHLNSGTAAYSIPLALPVGPAGFAPSLTLTYNTGFGNGPLGRGWRLVGPLAIERQTEKGFPRYGDGDNDVFVFGGEELVPLSDGTYRLENDEDFRRFSPVASRPGGPPDAWLIEGRDGTSHWLGRSTGASPSRVAHPGLGGRPSFDQTFRWREDAAEDVNGNRIDYVYRSFPDSPGVLYLARVTWRPAGSDSAYHVVELHTEERTDRLTDYRSGFERRWARRYREVSVGSSFEGARHRVRAYALSYDPGDGALASSDHETDAVGLGVSALHAVTQFGADRRWGGLDDPGTPLPPARFAYTRMRLRPFGPGLRSELAALRERLGRHEPDPLAAGPIVRQLRQEATPDRTSGDLFDVPVHEPRVEFADVDGDGLADILDTRLDSRRRRYAVARNLGGDRFGASRPLERHPRGVDLGQHTTDVQTYLSDADGDGLVDLVQIRGGRSTDRRTVLYANLADGAPGSGAFAADEPVVAYRTPRRVDVTSPDARQIDLDFDKISDVLVSSDRQWIGYVASADGTWGARPAARASRDFRDYRFSIDSGGGRRGRNPLVQLADMNGDRLLDLVRVRVLERGVADVRYRPMTGPLTWGAEVGFVAADRNGGRPGVPARLLLPGVTSDRSDRSNRWDAVRIMDANGDGLSDVVFVEPGRTVRVYFNLHGAAFAGPHQVSGTPPYRPRDARNPTLLRTADVNGNGSTDLVFAHRSGGPGVRGIRYLDFLGGQKPGLLSVADNGIGLRSHVRYKPAVVDQMAARESGAPWARVSPVSTWVVAGIVDDVGLDLDLDGGRDRYVTTFRYRDPYYDGFEKQFRGFRFAQQIEWGDDVDPDTGLPLREVPVGGHRTRVTRFGYHTGEPDGVDNDDYLDGFDTEPRPAGRTVDERTPVGGGEEEALKGKVFLQETVHPLALRDVAADFDACARALAVRLGPARERERCTPDRYVYRREETRWKIRRLYRPAGAVAPKGRLLREEPSVIARRATSVAFPHRVAVETTVPEANGVLRDTVDHPDAPVAVADPVTLEVEYEYDDFGNVVLERNWGITSGRDPPVDDERVVRTTFARRRGADGRIEPWILDRVVSRRVEDEHGAFASEERRFYDGAPFVGLPLGELGRRGLVSRLERRVSERSDGRPPLMWLPAAADEPLPGPGDPRDTPEWVVQERAEYDPFGNRVALADGLARMAADDRPDPDGGHVVLTTFDPVFHTFPVEERLTVGDGKPDLVFRAAYNHPETEYAAAAHWGHGVMTASWNPNGHRSDYLHDRHGRLTAVRHPGDSDALPSVVYAYRPADPHRGVRYEYDRSGRLQPNGTVTPVAVDQAANLVLTDRRETAGEEGVFRRASYSTGTGVEVLRLEEDRDGYAALRAVRLGRRGTPVFEAQPYRQRTLDFRVAGTDAVGTDLSRDPMDRVTRRRLPPEGDGPESSRLERMAHYLPLSEWRFDEEDLDSADPSQNRRGTPLVLHSDGLQRLIRATEHVRQDGVLTAWRTRYVHDLNDRLTGILDSQNNLRVMRYDGLGRRIALHDVNRGLLRFVFDVADNVVEMRDAKDQRTTWRYDGVNRVLSEDYHDAGQPFSSGREHDPQQPLSDANRPDVLFTYDEPVGAVELRAGRTVTPSNTRGFLTGVSDLSGEEHISYDARGRVAWQVKRVGTGDAPFVTYRTVMGHDSSDRLTDVEYPDGTRVSYRYDARSRTQHVDSPQLGVIVADQRYTASGHRANVTFGNGVVTSRSYDPRLRPRTITTRLPDDRPPFMDYRYRYDGASNVLALEDRRAGGGLSDNSQEFRYDDLHRLTNATYGTGRLSLTYDRIGNLTERYFAATGSAGAEIQSPGFIRHGGPAGSGGRIGRSTDDPGPQAPTSDQTGRTYSYDANGNLMRSGDLALTWDFKDRIVAADGLAMRAEYVYDYTGRRVVKRVWEGPSPRRGPPVETHYVSKYFEVAGETAQRYVFDGETRLARAAQGGDPIFYHHDLVASTDVLTDASGALIQSNAYLPFGGLRARHDEDADGVAAVTDGPEYLFAQKETDSETGLLYFDARYLDARLGRFIRVDPAIVDLPSEALSSPQLLNGYSFTGNNPFKYGDSSGAWIETAWDVFSLGISTSDFLQDPSGANAGWVALDIAAVVVPGLPAAGGAIKGGKLVAARKSYKALDSAIVAGQATGKFPMPRNLTEQIALKAAVAAEKAIQTGGKPIDGPLRIMQGLLKDPKFPEPVWGKFQFVHRGQDGKNTVIHYMKNFDTGETTQWKFK